MKFLGPPQSGSYQALTSSRNRYGQYFRTRATPVNPNSTFQAAVRARLALNAGNWRALTTTQIYGWGTFGANISRTDSLGQSYTLNGFESFVLVNNNRAAAGDALITDALLYALPDAYVSITPTATAATFSIAFTPTPPAAGERTFVSASPQRSAGRTFEGDMRLVAVTAAAAASPANIFAAYVARFGTPVVGAKIFVGIQRYASGVLSVPIISSVIVA